MTTNIFLIRHGKTAANLENRFAGRSPEPLHPQGIEQIQALADRLRGRDIARIYCGPLPRTAQSAAILQSMLNTEVTILDELNEIAIPHWDMLTKEEIRRRFGNEYPTWLSSPADFRLDDCETIGDVQKRAVNAVERLLERHKDENLLLVSHLIVLRALHLHYRNMSIDYFRTVKIDNGSVTCLSRTANSSTITTLPPSE